MSCLVLKDPVNQIELETCSQPTPIPIQYILAAQDRTPADYPLRWAGLAVTIGQIIEEDQPHIGRADWQKVLSGVPRRDSLYLAAATLAYMYKQRLPTSFISWYWPASVSCNHWCLDVYWLSHLLVPYLLKRLYNQFSHFGFKKINSSLWCLGQEI